MPFIIAVILNLISVATHYNMKSKDFHHLIKKDEYFYNLILEQKYDKYWKKVPAQQYIITVEPITGVIGAWIS